MKVYSKIRSRWFNVTDNDPTFRPELEHNTVKNITIEIESTYEKQLLLEALDNIRYRLINETNN